MFNRPLLRELDGTIKTASQVSTPELQAMLNGGFAWNPEAGEDKYWTLLRVEVELVARARGGSTG